MIYEKTILKKRNEILDTNNLNIIDLEKVFFRNN